MMNSAIESEAVRAAVDRVCGPWDRTDGPGLAIGVMLEGRVLLRRGYGLADVGSGRPNGPEVPMRIASLSKQFLTTLVLLLEAEGRLSIEDDVRAYLPFLPDLGMRVSLAQMLSHQSGLRDFLELRLLSGGGFDEPGPPEESIAIASAPTGLNFAPGSRFAYSNTGFLLLTLIVEQLTSQPLEAVLDERIFRPLGMRSTRLVRTDEPPIPGRALPYVETAAGLYPGRWGVTIGGEGGLVSTVDDLLIWARNLRRPTVGDSSLFARMSAPRPYAAGGSSIYGLGLTAMDYRGTRTHGHHGQLPGLFAEFAVFPDLDATIVLIANTSNLNPFALGRALADALFDKQLAVRPPVDLPMPAPPLAGRYHNSHDDMVLDLAVNVAGDLRIGTAMVNVPAEWHLPGRFRPLWPMNHLELSITPDAGALAGHACGQPVRFSRLESWTASAADLECAVGRFRQTALATDWTIELAGDSLSLVIEGPLGRKDFMLFPLAPGLFEARMAEEPVGPYRPLLRLTKGDSGPELLLSTDRTRALRAIGVD